MAGPQSLKVKCFSDPDSEAFHVAVIAPAGAVDSCDCDDYHWRHEIRGDRAHFCKHIKVARMVLRDGIPPVTAARASGRALAAYGNRSGTGRRTRLAASRASY